ncbi:hypothetical protein NIES2111_20940 [Nostoc sp. NIES-2111]|nr:hypothetical protein NIES2111_20940 [Nostoc sp. NIES-2111]
MFLNAAKSSVGGFPSVGNFSRQRDAKVLPILLAMYSVPQHIRKYYIKC